MKLGYKLLGCNEFILSLLFYTLCEYTILSYFCQ